MKLSQINEVTDFEDLFGHGFERNRIISEGEPQSSPYILKLYRGFDVNIDRLRIEGQYLILSPNKSEQGLIWFTHEFVRGYNPIEYVTGRGSHILTYHLKCIKHFKIIKWSDGSISTKIPEHILNQTEPTENCRFHMGIELPQGWVFSYKMEKFVGCSMELKITPDMLQEQ